ncbi:uncharacterized protein TRIADDRAFT_51434 [Trichoplax adhaerens]|uniref:DNA mismatch repair proteins mutS family domain-containing protein n=1 Tax=Trichoplax adhaerens TaxID=10228 RepID=B3RJ73_TRIAD|nr:hypothetical protein TRIADDRAFT_51434 [Trichoplax adhaerens]EDV29281.1 hypothetical protein TRIADDRAFT_51434 [Trichoplax adhaerens]|eukprot:XP_002108483.1 hypothetical protein TRIADDRAFT_51434 [Trichoplax adhaerens]
MWMRTSLNYFQGIKRIIPFNTRRHSKLKWHENPLKRCLITSPLALTAEYMFQQYLHIKAQYSDCLLLFQVGGFYELYNQDAHAAAGKTELFLSHHKKMGNNTYVDLAGFPIYALDAWLAKLTGHGFRVAVCNQTDSKIDTGRNSKLVHRQVTQVVTPGTFINPMQENASYLMAVCQGPGHQLGISWVDISTGDFQLTTVNVGNLGEELARINPVEIICYQDMQNLLNKYFNQNDSMQAIPSFAGKYDQLSLLPGFRLTPLKDNALEDDIWATMRDNGLKNTQISSIEESTIKMLLKYLTDTRGRHIIKTLTPKHYSIDDHMSIDPASRKSLELLQPLHNDASSGRARTLLHIIDNTVTSAGRRYLKADLSSPLTDITKINKRLDEVTYFYHHLTITKSICDILKTCGDMERLVQAFSTNMANVGHVIKLSQVLPNTQMLHQVLDENLTNDHSLRELINQLPPRSIDRQSLIKYLQGIVTTDDDETNFPAIGVDDKCDQIRSEINALHQQVVRLKDNFINLMPSGKLEIYKDLGYAYSLPKAESKNLQSTFNDSNVMMVKTKASRILFTDEKLQLINIELRRNTAKLNQRKNEFLLHLFNKITLSIDWLKRIAQVVARLDVACSLAIAAKDGKFIRPTFDDEENQLFQVVAGRHPVIESTTYDSSSYIPNDCNLRPSDRIWLLTGPNMAGKSTYLRQNAIISILAQIGSYVPADKAHLSIVDRLFTRIGSSDSIIEGRSTFMTEMLETAYFTSHATERSLVILDEIGRGTAMYDGMAIAWAVIEYLHDIVKCRCLTATHYHQLSRMVNDNLSCSSSYQMLTASKGVIDQNSLTLLHKVVPGHCQNSLGIEIADMAGIPSPIILRAKELRESRAKSLDVAEVYDSVDKTMINNERKDQNQEIKIDVRSIGSELVRIGNDLSNSEAYQADFLSLANTMTPEKASIFLQDLKDLLSNA